MLSTKASALLALTGAADAADVNQLSTGTMAVLSIIALKITLVNNWLCDFLFDFTLYLLSVCTLCLAKLIKITFAQNFTSTVYTTIKIKVNIILILINIKKLKLLSQVLSIRAF